jgi:hypothetical protein
MDMNRKIRLSEDQLTDLVHQILESKNKHVTCNRCDWDWDITAEDEDPYLCHMCGHRNDKKENKEGAGPYDAPAFEMEPDHTTFKHEYTEQDDEEERRFVSVEFLNDEPFQQTKNSKGPLKIIYDKLSGKEFVVEEDDLEVHYIFGGFSPGEKYDMFYDKDVDKRYVSAKVVIKKVLYKGMDVTPLVLKITNEGGWTKQMVKGDAWDRLTSVAKNLGMTVGKIRVDLYH